MIQLLQWSKNPASVNFMYGTSVFGIRNFDVMTRLTLWAVPSVTLNEQNWLATLWNTHSRIQGFMKKEKFQHYTLFHFDMRTRKWVSHHSSMWVPRNRSFTNLHIKMEQGVSAPKDIGKYSPCWGKSSSFCNLTEPCKRSSTRTRVFCMLVQGTEGQGSESLLKWWALGAGYKFQSSSVCLPLQLASIWAL